MNNQIRDKIKEKIIEPTTSGRSVSMLTGIITSCDEKTNKCSVKYTRQDGKEDNRDNIPIMLSNTGIIDWFPKVNDIVLLQQKENIIYVVGPAYSNYKNIRNKIQLESDIYTDSFYYTMGGYLF